MTSRSSATGGTDSRVSSGGTDSTATGLRSTEGYDQVSPRCFIYDGAPCVEFRIQIDRFKLDTIRNGDQVRVILSESGDRLVVVENHSSEFAEEIVE